MVWYDMVWCGMGLGHQARGSATRFSVAISVSFRNFFFFFLYLLPSTRRRLSHFIDNFFLVFSNVRSYCR